MKTFKTALAAIAFTATLIPTFTACSGEKDDEPSIPAAQSAAGTYFGNLISNVMGSESLFENTYAVLTATDDSNVTVTISEFGEAPMNMPSISIEEVSVKEAEGCLSLSSTEFSGTSETGKLYSGTMQGSVADGELNIRFTLNYGAMPMPLICTFTGSK